MKTYYNNNRLSIAYLTRPMGWHFSRVGFISLFVCFIFSLFSLPLAVADEVVDPAAEQVVHTEPLVYPADFFIQYHPRNALEMIERLPGFSLDSGSSARGFGGNAGNVLIDGSRPTSKSGGLDGALIRMPAELVAHIEVLHGGVSAGEAAGQAIVANIITRKNITSGTWAMRLRQTVGSRIRPNFEAVLSTNLGQWTTSFDADIGAEPFYRKAIVEERDVMDQLTSEASEAQPSRKQFAIVNGEGSRELAGGELTLNGHLSGLDWIWDTNRNVYTDQLPDDSTTDLFWVLNEKNKEREAELGIDWAKTDNNDWKLRLLGLGFVNNSRYNFNFHQQNADASTSGSAFVQERLRTETVGRVTYGKVGDSVFKPEFGIEIDNNRLDTDAFSAGQNGVFQAVINSDVVVEEWRAESFANFVYTASSALSLEGGVTAEFSQIKVSGDANQKQTFRFIKPRLSATYQFNPDTSLTFEVEREVGQLNFNDFAATSIASENRTTEGNPGLAPDHKTKMTSTFDWTFSERGSLKIQAFREWRKDVLETVLLSIDDSGRVNQATGNAGEATTWGIISELSLPLDYILHNGLIKFFHRSRRSDFDDPITGDDRKLSNFTPDWWYLDFRQDLDVQQVSWGFRYNGGFEYKDYLADEVQIFGSEKELTVFAETTRYFGVKIQFRVDNINTLHIPRTREFYEPTRNGVFGGREIAKRERSPTFVLSIFGEF